MPLGACCICGGESNVISVIAIGKKCPTPGRGWGCVVCRLPPDGAQAVLCDDCTQLWLAGQQRLRSACKGYPATDGRVAIEDLQGEHRHDMKFHSGARG